MAFYPTLENTSLTGAGADYSFFEMYEGKLSPSRLKKAAERFSFLKAVYEVEVTQNWGRNCLPKIPRELNQFSFQIDLRDPSIDLSNSIDILYLQYFSTTELTVDWGDGSIDTYTNGLTLSHKYDKHGLYTISVGPLKSLLTITDVSFKDAHLRVDVSDLWKFYAARTIQSGRYAEYHQQINMQWVTVIAFEKATTNVFYGEFDFPWYLKALKFYEAEFENAVLNLDELPISMGEVIIRYDIPEYKREQWLEEDLFDYDYCKDLHVIGHLSNLPERIQFFELSRCKGNLVGDLSDLNAFPYLDDFVIRHMGGCQLTGDFNDLPPGVLKFVLENTQSKLAGSIDVFGAERSGMKLYLGRVYNPEDGVKNPSRIQVRSSNSQGLPADWDMSQLSLIEVETKNLVFDLDDLANKFSFSSDVVNNMTHSIGAVFEFVRTGVSVVAVQATKLMGFFHKIRLVEEPGATFDVSLAELDSVDKYLILVDFTGSDNIDVSGDFSDLTNLGDASFMDIVGETKFSVRGLPGATISGNPFRLAGCKIVDLSDSGVNILIDPLASRDFGVSDVAIEDMRLRGVFNSSAEVDAFLRHVQTIVHAWKKSIEEFGRIERFSLDLRKNPVPSGSIQAVSPDSGKAAALSVLRSSIPAGIAWDGIADDLRAIRDKSEREELKSVFLEFFSDLSRVKSNALTPGATISLTTGDLVIADVGSTVEKTPAGVKIVNEAGESTVMYFGEDISSSSVLDYVIPGDSVGRIDFGFSSDQIIPAKEHEGHVTITSGPGGKVEVYAEPTASSLMQVYAPLDKVRWVARLSARRKRWFLFADGLLNFVGEYDDLDSYPYAYVGNLAESSEFSVKKFGRMELSPEVGEVFKEDWARVDVDQATPSVGGSWPIGSPFVQVDFDLTTLTNESLELMSRDQEKWVKFDYATSGSFTVSFTQMSGGTGNDTFTVGTGVPISISVLIEQTSSGERRAQVFSGGAFVGEVDLSQVDFDTFSDPPSGGGMSGPPTVEYLAGSGGGVRNLRVRSSKKGSAYLHKIWPDAREEFTPLPLEFYMELVVNKVPTADLQLFGTHLSRNLYSVAIDTHSTGEVEVYVTAGKGIATSLLMVTPSVGDKVIVRGNFVGDYFVIQAFHVSSGSVVAGATYGDAQNPYPIEGVQAGIYSYDDAASGVFSELNVWPIRMADFGLIPSRLFGSRKLMVL